MKTLYTSPSSIPNNRPILLVKLQSIERLLENTEAIILSVKRNYAEEIWQPIADNYRRAADSVAAAKAHLAKSDEFAAAAQTDNADTEINATYHQIGIARDLLEAIVFRHCHLDQTHMHTPEEFRLAKSDIAKAKTYLSEHPKDPNIQKHYSSVQDAEKHLAAAQTEFAKDRPNIDLVAAKILTANHSIHHILDLCLSESEQAIRKRRQFATRNTNNAYAAARRNIQQPSE